MASPDTSPPAGEPLGLQEPSLGHPILAWILILALVGLAIFSQSRPSKGVTENTLGELQRNVLRIQGQYLVAAAELSGMSRQQLYEGAQPLNTGTLDQRLAFVVLAGELAGPAEALRQLERNQAQIVRQEDMAEARSVRLLRILQRLYEDYAEARWQAPSVTAEGRALLMNELGWFGSLALAPRSETGDPNLAARETDGARQAVLASARRTFLIVILGMLALLAAGGLGLLSAIAFTVLAVTGKLTAGIQTGTRHSGVYAETFALWMVLLAAISLTAAVLPEARQHQLLASAAASLLSLSVLAWPVIRGVSWERVRIDLGLYAGQTPLREAAWGVVCYASTLPIIAVGFLTTLSLFRIKQWMSGTPDTFGPVESPAHPIIEWVSEAGFTGRLSIALLACVIAPLVEETVFRGALYRQLRDTSARWRTAISVTLAAGVNSLIFAVIHPQGLLAAPVLMSIAIGLSLAREWRGSLLAPMVMHGLNNGIMLTMLLSLI